MPYSRRTATALHHPLAQNMRMKTWKKIAVAAVALLIAYYSGHHYGYIDGVIEATADCLMTYQPPIAI